MICQFKYVFPLNYETVLFNSIVVVIDNFDVCESASRSMSTNGLGNEIDGRDRVKLHGIEIRGGSAYRQSMQHRAAYNYLVFYTPREKRSVFQRRLTVARTREGRPIRAVCNKIYIYIHICIHLYTYINICIHVHTIRR